MVQLQKGGRKQACDASKTRAHPRYLDRQGLDENSHRARGGKSYWCRGAAPCSGVGGVVEEDGIFKRLWGEKA